MKNIIVKIKVKLEKAADPVYKRFHEDSMMIYASKIIGVRVPVLNACAKELYAEIKSKTSDEIIKICDELVSCGIYDIRKIGIETAWKMKKRYEKHHFKTVRRWVLEELEDWGDCDSLCTHVTAEFMMKFPELLSEILSWAGSEKFIVRRAACVNFIVPGKRGMYLKEILSLSKKLMYDPHDLVLKGYGWALKEASKKHQKEVFDFVFINRYRMPRTALRYAIEKMPEKLRKMAMGK